MSPRGSFSENTALICEQTNRDSGWL